uniref:MgtC/SapB family protein n=1 Tax=Hylemonella sp. TaxID=2066020 RepID=UPI0035AE4834
MELGNGALTSLALALGIGLLIGVERERRKGQGPTRQFAGVRSFTLVALLGAGTELLGQVWLTALAGALVAALVVVAYWRDRSADPGVTTEIALFLTFVLGLLAVPYPAVAAGGGVVVAGLLAARGPLQQFATQTLSEQELRNALILAAAALVVLPLTPDAPLAWLAGVNPRQLWRLVVLILAVQAVGDVALRLFGARLGLALSGLVSGFVSSTATIATMGARAREHPELRTACMAAAWFSTVSTSLLLMLLALTLGGGVLATLAPLLGASLIAALLLGLGALRRSPLPTAQEGGRSRAFNLRQALGLALLFTGIAALAAWTQASLGAVATLLTATLAGLADAHAASAAAMALAVRGELDAGLLQLAVLLAFSSNTLSKMVAAWVAGGVRYGAPVSAGLLAVVLAAWLPWLWQRV